MRIVEKRTGELQLAFSFFTRLAGQGVRRPGTGVPSFCWCCEWADSRATGADADECAGAGAYGGYKRGAGSIAGHDAARTERSSVADNDCKWRSERVRSGNDAGEGSSDLAS